VKQALLVLLLTSAALARKPPRARPGPQLDPSRFFPSQAGLVRIYEGRAKAEAGGGPPAGASCEVLESRARDSLSPGSMRESCSMILGRKAKPATELTYELRKDGIWNVEVRAAGAAKAQAVQRLVLPAPLRVGATWKEPRGGVELARTVKSAGGSCKAAGRSFADCLVLSVVQKQGKSVVRRYTETYAAGVGLVEDAQWALVDVKGL
jgi:hypothetical protein